MKLLSGADLASYIQQRQAGQVRALIQADHIKPCLAIVVTKNDPVIETYIGLKKQYGEDIQIKVDIHNISQKDAVETVKTLNKDENVHGIIVQLPLDDTSQTDEIINCIAPHKDVDGLGSGALYDAATPQAIDWLLVGYNIDLRNKHIVIVGKGRLVGAPLLRMWQSAGYDVVAIGKKDDLQGELKKADVIISATGQPHLISSEMVPVDSIVVDAGTSSEGGKTVGDLDEDVYQRQDLTITPAKGGVGPLTIAALFDNLIRAVYKN